MTKKIFTIVLLIILSFSCQKELEIKLPDFEPKPVVNCLFSTDTNFVLNLSHSISLNDSIKVNIETAKCYLFSDEILIDSLSYISDGFYKSNIKPEQGKYYELKVISTYFDEVYSISNIPSVPQILNIEQQNFAVPPPVYSSDVFENLPLNKFSITFSDDAKVDNYYELKILIKRYWADIHEKQMQRCPRLFSYDDVIRNENILDYEPNLFVFSDSLFNGQTKTIDFLYKQDGVTRGCNSDNCTYFYGQYRIYYKFRSISKEMYDYRKSLIKHVYNQQTGDVQLFGDPVPMFSNIKNGLGVFAGYSEVFDSLFVEETIFSF